MNSKKFLYNFTCVSFIFKSYGRIFSLKSGSNLVLGEWVVHFFSRRECFNSEKRIGFFADWISDARN